MGPNESWMSDVERELKRQQDQLTGLSVNQLALQGQGNYQLPSRIQQPDQNQTDDEIIWIRLTEKISSYGQNLYSWRRQNRTLTPSGYNWSDTGDSSTYAEYPAVGLNNDDVTVGTDKRYPAKWIADTSQWVFFSNQVVNSSSSMFRWEYRMYLSCDFGNLPTIASGVSANSTADQAALDAAILFLRHCHVCSRFRNRYLSHANDKIWDFTTVSIRGKSNPTNPAASSSNITLWNSHVVDAIGGGSVGYFPDGVPSTGSGNGLKVLSNISAGQYVPRVNFYQYQSDPSHYNPDTDWNWDVGDYYYPGSTVTNNDNIFLGNFYKTVFFKKYRANGTWDGSSQYTLSVYGTFGNGTEDGIAWRMSYGPEKDTYGNYTVYSSGGGGGSNFNTFNGTITVAWGLSVCGSSGVSGNIDPTTP